MNEIKQWLRNEPESLAFIEVQYLESNTSDIISKNRNGRYLEADR